MAKLSDHDPRKDYTHDDDDATLDGASESDSDPNDNAAGASELTTAEPSPTDSAGIKAAKAFGIGLVCVVGIPVAAALVTVGGMLYGAGKVLEGVGGGLSAGPEAVLNAAYSSKEEQKPTEAPKPKPKSKRKSKKKKKKSQ